MKRYTIQQDVDDHVEHGFYLVIDDATNKLVNYFQFKKEAMAYVTAIKLNGIDNVNPEDYNAEIRNKWNNTQSHQ